MKLCAIHTSEAGPLGTQIFDFRDSWNGIVGTNILFSGPNGCGKSTILRIPAMLWNAFGHWIHTRKALSRKSPECELFQRWGGVAVVLEELPLSAPPLVLIYGQEEFVAKLRNLYPEHAFVGERVKRNDKPGNQTREILCPKSTPWLDRLTEARKKMMISWDKSELPNVIFLDAEERRWIPPKRGIGEMKPEDLAQRWLSRYQVSENWEGQLESSLLNLKAAESNRFLDLISDMNAFLCGKEILRDVQLGENRLRVKLTTGTEGTHGLDELSAGEHQVLIQLYLINRWMEKGGIVLIDEPDLYLHPSLVSGFLARLEKMVADRKGQLIITSHVPDVWNRYEAIGQRVLLGAPK